MTSRLPFSQRIVIAFVLMTMVVSGSFSLGIVAVVHFVEDQLISKELYGKLNMVLHEDIKAGREPRLDARTRFLPRTRPVTPSRSVSRTIPMGSRRSRKRTRLPTSMSWRSTVRGTCSCRTSGSLKTGRRFFSRWFWRAFCSASSAPGGSAWSWPDRSWSRWHGSPDRSGTPTSSPPALPPGPGLCGRRDRASGRRLRHDPRPAPQVHRTRAPLHQRCQP